MDMMIVMPDWIVYINIVSIWIYSLMIVPYFGSKILIKFGGSKRFWYIIIIIFNGNLWLLILLIPKFRKQLLFKEIIISILFFLGYIAFITPLFLHLRATEGSLFLG